MMKTAILGGTFDPVHKGHIQIAKTALEKLGVDEVWFMPAYLTPLKDRKITPAKDRLAMLDLALQDEEQMKICDLELKRGKKSYTIDTARELKQLYPEREFVWLIGADQLAQFDQWKDVDELVELMDFAAVGRNDLSMDTKYPVTMLEMEPMDISSTDIRNFEKLDLVPEPVLHYIYEKPLYLCDYLAKIMPQKRYFHSLFVASLCRNFAIANGLDSEKAYLAGLLHDVTKYVPAKEQREMMKLAAPDYVDLPAPVWHGFTGAYFIEKHLLINDPDILNAVYWHVLGKSRNPYAMACYCADKLDPLRDYNSSSLLMACMQDLESGFDQVLKENRKYLKKEKKKS